jgi:FtsZ-binding cell division protein ZapB
MEDLKETNAKLTEENLNLINVIEELDQEIDKLKKLIEEKED